MMCFVFFSNRLEQIFVDFFKILLKNCVLGGCKSEPSTPFQETIME